MTEAAETNPGATTFEIKFTAEQIETCCPVLLQDWGKRIAVHSEKAQKCEDKRDQHYATMAQLIAMGHGACEEGGFNAFREKFFPNLGKSRVYELLAIGTHKKSYKDIKASARARVAKHRANKVLASVSVTVTENLKPEMEAQEPATQHGVLELQKTTPAPIAENPKPEALSAPSVNGAVQATSTAPEQMPEPAKSLTAATPEAQLMSKFDMHTIEVWRTISNYKVERFVETHVPPDHLAKVGKFLISLSHLIEQSAECIMQDAVDADLDAPAELAND